MFVHLLITTYLFHAVYGYANAASQESSAAFVGFPNCQDSTICAAKVSADGSVQEDSSTECDTTSTTVNQETIDQFSNSAYNVVFENNAGEPVRLWWDDGKGGVFQGDVETQVTITTYVGHKFFFTPADTMERLWSTVMLPSVEHVILYDRQTMATRTAEQEHERIKWMQDYHARTGRTWRNYWPRKPVQHFVYDITEIGQIFPLKSNATFAVECPSDLTESTDELTIIDTTFNGTDFRYCVETKPFQIDLEVLCTQPRVIRAVRKDLPSSASNLFVSKFEASHIISLGHQKGLARSTVSEAATLTADRTSSTCWIERESSPIVDRVIRRIADVIQVNEESLYLNRSSESLQLVWYKTGELYKSHHDYGTDRPNNRFITFLMYLNDVGEGGNTSFPDADASCRDENGYFGLHPGEGNALFFYNLYADGNVDPSTLHFAEPPTNGEKYMSNLWIWDPFFS